MVIGANVVREEKFPCMRHLVGKLYDAIPAIPRLVRHLGGENTLPGGGKRGDICCDLENLSP